VQSPNWLTGLDACFLNLETPVQPLQNVVVMDLEISTIPGGYSYDRFCEELGNRIRAVPQLREKLSGGFPNIDHPAWVEDREFDVNNHVHRFVASNSASRTDILKICASLFGSHLDRSRPLWGVWVIERVGEESCVERLSVVFSVHHSVADGVTYSSFFSYLFSAEPNPPRPELVPTTGDDRPSSIALGGLANFLARSWILVSRVVPESARAIRDAFRRSARGRAMAAPFSAPPTIFNSRFTSKRTIGLVHLDLAEVKNVKNHFGVTVTDVVVTLVSGAVRSFLLEREELPSSTLTALVPTSVHEPGRHGRNQVSGMLAKMHTQIDDPVERLCAVAASNASAKEHSAAISGTLLEDYTQLGGRVLMGLAKRAYGWVTHSRPMYNVVVSNVPAPEFSEYFLGARILSACGFGPIMLGAGLNVTVWPVGGTLNLGLTSCPEVLPDLFGLERAIKAGLDQLLAEVERSSIS
jgi:WS/DGAT/MGAT family acyltransferase